MAIQESVWLWMHKFVHVDRDSGNHCIHPVVIYLGPIDSLSESYSSSYSYIQSRIARVCCTLVYAVDCVLIVRSYTYVWFTEVSADSAPPKEEDIAKYIISQCFACHHQSG